MAANNNTMRKLTDSEWGILLGGIGGAFFGAILSGILCAALGEYQPYTSTNGGNEEEGGEIRTGERLTDEGVVNYMALPLAASIVAGILLGYLYSQRATIGQSLKNMNLSMFRLKNTGTEDNTTRQGIINSIG